MRGLYGKVLPEVICTDRGTKEQGQCGIPKAKLSRRDRVNDVNKGFVTSQFVLTSEKSPVNTFAAQNFHSYLLVVFGNALAC